MSKKNIIKGSAESRKDGSGNTSSVFRDLMDGSLLTRNTVQKQLPFIFFLALLGLFYISNGYHADRIKRNIKVLKTDLGELKAKALYTSSELMKMGRQTEVAEYLKRYGLELKESENPPKKIVVNKIPSD